MQTICLNYDRNAIWGIYGCCNGANWNVNWDMIGSYEDQDNAIYKPRVTNHNRIQWSRKDGHLTFSTRHGDSGSWDKVHTFATRYRNNVRVGIFMHDSGEEVSVYVNSICSTTQVPP